MVVHPTTYNLNSLPFSELDRNGEREGGEGEGEGERARDRHSARTKQKPTHHDLLLKVALQFRFSWNRSQRGEKSNHLKQQAGVKCFKSSSRRRFPDFDFRGKSNEKCFVSEMFLLVFAVLVAADECPPVFGSSINLTAAAYQVKMAPIKSSGILTSSGQPFQLCF